MMIESFFKSIGHLASHGHLHDAFKTFSLLRLQSSTSLVSGLQIHSHCISSGVEYHSALVPKLVTFYSAFNHHSEALLINENSGLLHPLPWNVLISSYAKNHFFEEAITAYRIMVSKGIRPDAFTYPSGLKACGETLDIASGSVVYGSIEYISCYASEGMWSEAFELFEEMWFSGVEVSVITWNIISGGCLHTGNHAGALGLVSRTRQFPKRGCDCWFEGLLACRSNTTGERYHGHAIRSFYDGIDNVRNTLITMYSKCDDLRHAFIVFQQIEENSLCTWNSIISGYAQVNRSEEASYLLRKMLFAGFQPNYITLASILPLWCSDCKPAIWERISLLHPKGEGVSRTVQCFGTPLLMCMQNRAKLYLQNLYLSL